MLKQNLAAGDGRSLFSSSSPQCFSLLKYFPVGSCVTHRREFPAALPMPAAEVL
jgi:hypothetical protein